MKCEFKELKKGEKCLHCGRPLAMDFPAPYYRLCKEEQLGDWTERMLKSVGITKKRYKAIKKRLGLSPDCKCNERQLLLNYLSENGLLATVKNYKQLKSYWDKPR